VYGRMVHSIVVSGMMIELKVMVFINGPMAKSMKVIGSVI
jgi:hypothetical protein